jgi:hypothetical protein
MHSLFSKIFACFWLSHLIIVGLVWAILTASQEARDERQLESRRGAIVLAGAELARLARRSAEANPNERPRLFEEIKSRTGLRAALFNANGALITGQSPRDGARLALEAARSGEAELRIGRGGIVSARRARAANGELIVLRWSANDWGRVDERLRFWVWNSTVAR